MIEKFDTRLAGLYIGCKCDITWNLADGTVEVWPGEDLCTKTLYELGEGNLSVVPHLRSMDSLTELEARDLFEIATAGVVWEKRSESCLKKWWEVLDIEQYIVGHALIGSPLVWLKLLEWGFDLFGLIPAGLAKEIPAQ